MCHGRNVVVTAAARGIGLAVARAFAAQGDRVHICDVDERALEDVGKSQPTVTGAICDVSDRSSVEAFIDAAAETLGGIDVLVNNAGISGPTAPVEELDPDQWDRVLALNLTGTFNATRRSIPHLKRSAAGVIIIMSSLGGRFGYPNRCAYATTKRGLIGFAETLALELGEHGVRTNVIAPGPVEGVRVRQVLQARADASGRSIEDEVANALDGQAIKRFVDPNEIAGLAVFLASDHAKSISGQTIGIDGEARAGIRRAAFSR